MTEPEPRGTPPSGQPQSPAHADGVRGNHLVAFVAIGALALLAVAAVVLAFTLGRGELLAGRSRDAEVAPHPDGAVTMATSSSSFSEVAVAVLASSLAHDPVNATFLGEHRHDGMLPDPSPAAADVRRTELHRQLAAVDAAAVGSADDRVDAAILRTALRAELFELDHIRSAEWDPMPHNPGNGLHALVSRNFAPLPERVRHLAQRLRAVPAYLAAARERLGVMSLIHLDTAQAQLDGTLRLLDDAIPNAVAQDRSAADLSVMIDRARAAVVAHKDWLADQRDRAEHDPRLGAAALRRTTGPHVGHAVRPGCAPHPSRR